MRHALPVLLLACALPLTAQAQEAAAPQDPVVLRVEQGSVMVSEQGAEFISLEIDVSLRPEDRVLVPEGSVASLDYGNGCVVRLVTGAYPVAASCPLTPVPVAGAPVAPPAPVATASSGSNTGIIVGVVAGVAAVAAAAGGGGSSSSDPPPVSR